MKVDIELYEYIKLIFLYLVIIFLLFFLLVNCIVDESLKFIFRLFNEIREKEDYKLLRKYSVVFFSERGVCFLIWLEI